MLFKPEIELVLAAFGKEPPARHVGDRRAAAIKPEQTTQQNCIGVTRHARGDCSDAASRPRDMVAVVTQVARSAVAPHIGHEIAITFMATSGCEVVARLRGQQRHECVDQGCLATARRTDDRRVGRINAHAMAPGESAPVVQVQLLQREARRAPFVWGLGAGLRVLQHVQPSFES
ncbi:hypothetical protein SDC9_78812 [bioreactor metagenome]|uniref:Uncharacterized protein n=1 Tax=bioreactor metagenome TaxID=1076179 RepID=A0A644YUH8_9ZZZZ